MTERERALTKLNVEINKDIDLAIEMGRLCGLVELLYFVYQLHWVRLIHLFPRANDVKQSTLSVYSNSEEESIKYIISLVVKFGSWKAYFRESEKVPTLNSNLVQVFLKHGNYINSKYEIESVVNLFEVHVSGERDQHVRVDMSSLENDPDIKRLFDYFLRIDYDNDIKKNSKSDKERLIESFKEEYLPFADLFEEEFKITVEEFCWLNTQLLERLTDRISSKELYFEKLSSGNIDVTSQKTFFNFIPSLLYNKDKFYKSFEEKFHSVLDRLVFQKDNFDEHQLRFHHVTRHPLFVHENILIISPELLLDSLFTNIHYSLIESASIKNRYIARQASLYLDKLAAIASKFGYTEVEREKDLFEGKNKIGDIDLILKDEAGHFLLIEAKNHSLPLDVYFRDVTKTINHLKYLQKEWERKVLRRADHLKSNHEHYSIPTSYDYIVVSRYPEIISHYSSLFVISTQEFKVWLQTRRETLNFEEFYKQYAERVQPELTIEELEDMREANLLLGKFVKE